VKEECLVRLVTGVCLVLYGFIIHYYAGLEFSRLESWSRDVSRLNFESLGLEA